jgi:antitoxin component of MazEF toxin-antitoxin module
MKISTLAIKETSDGDLFIELPPDLLEDLGWEEGDEVKFIDKKNGKFLIKKMRYASIELEFDDDELFEYMQLAHRRNQSFNEFCEQAFKAMIENETSDDRDN